MPPRSVERSFLLLLLALTSSVEATTYTVNNNGDPASGAAPNCAAGNTNTCTLRDAIAASVGGDTIIFNLPAGSTTIKLTTNTQLTLAITTGTVTIDGANVSGAGQVAVDGNRNTSVFYTNPSTTTDIRNLTVQNGLTHLFGGGGVYNLGTLTLTNSTLSGNATSNILVPAIVPGGGILNLGTLSLINSTLSGNTASTMPGDPWSSAYGGGICNVGTLSLTNSTLSGNTANTVFGGSFGSAEGGGIYNSGKLTIANSTLSGNSAIGTASAGGGMFNAGGNVTLINTIIADGCMGIPNDGGGNIDIGTSCSFGGSSKSNVGTINLGPLQNNGGPTQTMLPGAGSTAIDAIACTSAPATDQRGVSRPQGTKCDIGAVEVQQGAGGSAAVPAPTLDRWAFLALGAMLLWGVWSVQHRLR